MTEEGGEYQKGEKGERKRNILILNISFQKRLLSVREYNRRRSRKDSFALMGEGPAMVMKDSFTLMEQGGEREKIAFGKRMQPINVYERLLRLNGRRGWSKNRNFDEINF